MRPNSAYEPGRDAPATAQLFAVTAPIRVLLADAATLVLAGLRFVLSRSPDLEIVGEAHDGPQTLQGALRLAPDVVVLDVALPGQSGLEVLDERCTRCPNVRALVLSQRRSEDAMRAAFEHGAAGYFLKDENLDELPAVVRAVYSGRFHLLSGASCNIRTQHAGSTHRAHIMRKLDVHRSDTRWPTKPTPRGRYLADRDSAHRRVDPAGCDAVAAPRASGLNHT